MSKDGKERHWNTKFAPTEVEKQYMDIYTDPKVVTKMKFICNAIENSVNNEYNKISLEEAIKRVLSNNRYAVFLHAYISSYRYSKLRNELNQKKLDASPFARIYINGTLQTNYYDDLEIMKIIYEDYLKAKEAKDSDDRDDL